MATKLGDVSAYKRLYLEFGDEDGFKKTITINNPKNVEDGDYEDIEEQDEILETVMDTIIENNIFHNKGNSLTTKVNARIVEYRSQDVMDPD